jgi:hypothetical protein
MLKWTARAFAIAAAMQLSLASAQEAEDTAIAPPGPTVTDEAAEEVQETNEAIQDANENAREVQQDAFENRQEAAEETRENLQDARDEVQDAREDAADELNEANRDIQREARFRPQADGGQVDERVRAATANLNIDDATRSRYRWHNGEWWFKTSSGNWKFHRDGQWQDFDPTTYQARNSGSGAIYGSSSGATYGSSSGNWVPQGNTTYVQPQQFSGSNGYSYQSQPYTTQRYGVARPNYDSRYYNQGWNNQGWNNNRGWNNGWNNGYNNGYYNNGYGYNSGWGTGYNPGNDRFYGRGPYGQPYSISGDRYRGGVIGSEIGGQLGGRTGAILGGAIGADAAD